MARGGGRPANHPSAEGGTPTHQTPVTVQNPTPQAGSSPAAAESSFSPGNGRGKAKGWEKHGDDAGSFPPGLSDDGGSHDSGDGDDDSSSAGEGHGNGHAGGHSD